MSEPSNNLTVQDWAPGAVGPFLAFQVADITVEAIFYSTIAHSLQLSRANPAKRSALDSNSIHPFLGVFTQMLPYIPKMPITNNYIHDHVDAHMLWTFPTIIPRKSMFVVNKFSHMSGVR